MKRTQEERRKKQYDHFSQLLGKSPVVDNEDQEILPILKNLQYVTGSFDMSEYHQAKKQIRKAKLQDQMEFLLRFWRGVISMK